MGHHCLFLTELLGYFVARLTLQVRCTEMDAVGRRCRWTGRRDQLNSHQHDYDQPAASVPRQSAPAGRKRRAESHDEAPSAKAVRVDVSGTTQTSSVPDGTAGVELNESSSVRAVTAANVPDLLLSSTNDDPHHIRANDDHGDEEARRQEDEEEWDVVVHALRVAAIAVADDALASADDAIDAANDAIAAAVAADAAAALAAAAAAVAAVATAKDAARAAADIAAAILKYVQYLQNAHDDESHDHYHHHDHHRH